MVSLKVSPWMFKMEMVNGKRGHAVFSLFLEKMGKICVQ